MQDFDLGSLQTTLSHNVKLARKAIGLSQEALALEADVDRTYVSQIERAVSNPSLLVLAKIAAVLGKNVPELLTRPVISTKK